MHGVRRVIVFCLLTTVLPTILLIIPLYLRYTVFANVVFAVMESDVVEISDGISPIFCSEHSLRMNDTFNAFQVSRRPEKSNSRKHIRLRKSMILPDDTLEYWGFYLLNGATVKVSVCSRYPGAAILVTKGNRNLHTCGLLDHNKNKVAATGIYSPKARQQVKITYESKAQEIDSDESQDVQFKHGQTKAKMKKVIGSKSKEEFSKSRPVRNVMKFDNLKPDQHLKMLEQELNSNSEISSAEVTFEAMEQIYDEFRVKRGQKPVKPELLDQGIQHGGNAPTKNDTSSDSNESNVSSFENSLFVCYSGNVLLQSKFNSSKECTNVDYLLTGDHMQATHEIAEDGYFYYIFYSDNDFISNDIHAVFDIYKPTLQYENVTKACVNQTDCKFSLNMTSSDRVIVEVPTRDGIDRDLDDTSLLISICNPRMEIYAIFPIAVLFLVLGCAFI